MQSQPHPTAPHDNAKRIRIDELTDVGTTLTADELDAVSGALPPFRPSWTSGASGRTDEWVR